MDQLLHAANPKIFDPDNNVTVSEEFDVDDFNRTIHESRDVDLHSCPD